MSWASLAVGAPRSPSMAKGLLATFRGDIFMRLPSVAMDLCARLPWQWIHALVFHGDGAPHSLCLVSVSRAVLLTVWEWGGLLLSSSNFVAGATHSPYMGRELRAAFRGDRTTRSSSLAMDLRVRLTWQDGGSQRLQACWYVNEDFHTREYDWMP